MLMCSDCMKAVIGLRWQTEHNGKVDVHGELDQLAFYGFREGVVGVAGSIAMVDICKSGACVIEKERASIWEGKLNEG